MFHLAPSILSADFTILGQQIRSLEEAGVEWLHIDVMDGSFVPSISFGMPVIKSLRKKTSLFFDVHLMVQDPGRYIGDFVDCGADMITVHQEACTHLDRVLQSIRDEGIKAGVALNPATPLGTLEYVLEKVDMVLLMTVNPGFGGQKYIESSTRKIWSLARMIEDRSLQVDIQVDGGINDSTLPTVLDAGANIIVAGSAVFQGDLKENASRMIERIREQE